MIVEFKLEGWKLSVSFFKEENMKKEEKKVIKKISKKEKFAFDNGYATGHSVALAGKAVTFISKGKCYLTVEDGEARVKSHKDNSDNEQHASYFANVIFKRTKIDESKINEAFKYFGHDIKVSISDKGQITPEGKDESTFYLFSWLCGFIPDFDYESLIGTDVDKSN